MRRQEGLKDLSLSEHLGNGSTGSNATTSTAYYSKIVIGSLARFCWDWGVQATPSAVCCDVKVENPGLSAIGDRGYKNAFSPETTKEKTTVLI